jgi:hypothetical protein
MDDSRVMSLARHMLRQGYFDNELDARRAAKRLTEEVEEICDDETADR